MYNQEDTTGFLQLKTDGHYRLYGAIPLSPLALLLQEPLALAEQKGEALERLGMWNWSLKLHLV